MNKLYIREKKPKYIRIDKFIKNLYKKEYGFPATYYNKLCNNNQRSCSKGKNRSLDSLYYLVKTYYPKTTYEKFILAIKKLCINNYSFNIIFCDNIEKLVVYYCDWKDKKKLCFDKIIYDYCSYIKRDKYCTKEQVINILFIMGYTKEEIYNEFEW